MKCDTELTTAREKHSAKLVAWRRPIFETVIFFKIYAGRAMSTEFYLAFDSMLQLGSFSTQEELYCTTA